MEEEEEDEEEEEEEEEDEEEQQNSVAFGVLTACGLKFVYIWRTRETVEFSVPVDSL